MEEIWKDIVIEKNGKLFDFTGKYEVSNLGNVRSLNYMHTGKKQVLRPALGKDDYLRIGLYYNGKREDFFVHRLVATVFLPNPDNLKEVNHIDENKQNNSVMNLEWCDRIYNINYGNRNAKASETIKRLQAKKILDKGELINMAIDANKKTRINLTIEHDLKAKVEQLAKEDERSTNGMIIKLIKEALQARGEL